jgi:hypothetical protein
MENEIRIILHNYGSLPTLAMDSRTVGNAAPITVEDILASKFAREDVGVILPGQNYEHFVDVDYQFYALARAGNVSMNLGFILNYEYGKDKVGEYGFIARYNHEKNAFVFVKEWGKPLKDIK